MNKLPFINIGCGNRYHPDWVNIDLNGDGKEVIKYNVCKPLPFQQGQFKVVYHAHILEHLDRNESKLFIEECNRILAKGGIIRVVVPDLEDISRNYLNILENALVGEPIAKENYDWIVLEMLDQIVRTQSGGEMANYLAKPNLKNEAFVYMRIGEEGRNLRRQLLHKATVQTEQKIFKKSRWGLIKTKLKELLITYLLRYEWKEYLELKENQQYIMLRKSGELHKWMYDRYSLAKLLADCGFREIKVVDAFSSAIPNWVNFNLDAKESIIYKPDSLYVEAIK